MPHESAWRNDFPNIIDLELQYLILPWKYREKIHLAITRGMSASRVS
jgi:hypothetical protein